MTMPSSEYAFPYDPGVVFWLPPYGGLPGDASKNGHPHALAIRAEPDGFGILVYGSTQDTEAGGGAERHSVKPRPHGRSPNGLPRLTHFYPGVLALREYADLPERAGYLGSDLAGLRGKLRSALGIGEGCAGKEGHLPGSWRGRIVELSPEAQAVLGTHLAVVVTAARYSRARSYQVVVPIYDGTGRSASAPVVSVMGERWLSRVGDEVSSALLVVPSTVSVWHERHIVDRGSPVVVEGEVMELLDRNLCTFFELEPPQ